MSEDLQFASNIIRELLDFMHYETAEITEEIKEDKLERANSMIAELQNLPREESEDTIILPERLSRFGKLDPAQKAFVIIATADKELDFSTLIEKGKNLDVIVKTSYLKEVRWFSLIAKKIEDLAQGKEYIKEYLEKYPRLKRIGCGNFARNFPDHVFKLLGHLLYPKVI